MDKSENRAKAQALTARLTLEEKIGMIHGAHLFATQGVARLGIPPLVMSDGPMGVRQEFKPDQWQAVGHSDDYVTYLPCNSALASTWNRRLAGEMGSVLGCEARGRGKDIILAPGVNIKRSPLCGRNFEYFSEDPCLTGELASWFIRGVQQWDVAACVKHFAANNQETRRHWVDVKVDERALREIYLPAFYDCLTQGGSLSVMGAYNRLYGEHCCQSRYLLHDILRQEWGYEGVVISDWGGVHDTELAAMSELDIEMSVTDDFDEYYMAQPLKRAVEQGKIPQERIDEKVTRILMLMMRLHMLGGTGNDPDGTKDHAKDTQNAGKRKQGAYNMPEHRKAALETARESIVLLKNEESRLPLDARKVKKILLVGENAVRIHSNGGGSAEIKALYELSPMMGIKMLLGGNVQVDFVRGYGSGDEKDTESRKAVQAAGAYDTVIFVGGLNHDYDNEGQDRSDMKLPYGQDALLSELLAVKPDTIVVLVGGSPVEMGGWIGQAKTVVWSYYAGMEGGYALAEVLFGRVNPSGKLPETFYKKLTDCSAHRLGEFAQEESVSYGEGVFVGYRYNETFGVQPEFCFGHGLSYTEFAYLDAVLEEEDGVCRVVCTIKNTGTYAGAETVQVYRMIKERPACSPQEIPSGPAGTEKLAGLRPVKELVGFEKIYLAPGETGQVAISIRRKPDCGMDLGIGASVRDIRITLAGAE